MRGEGERESHNVEDRHGMGQAKVDGNRSLEQQMTLLRHGVETGDPSVDDSFSANRL